VTRPGYSKENAELRIDSIDAIADVGVCSCPLMAAYCDPVRSMACSNPEHHRADLSRL
jgi:hypothetical protein